MRQRLYISTGLVGVSFDTEHREPLCYRVLTVDKLQKTVHRTAPPPLPRGQATTKNKVLSQPKKKKKYLLHPLQIFIIHHEYIL
eukprot:jgi/Botrbrau1/11957/Bobra.341_1s0022.1